MHDGSDYDVFATSFFSCRYKSFIKEICQARTFCLKDDVEMLRANGFAQGGSLDNAVVVDENGILNEGGLRFPDEFVRHKLLDCVGDFALLGLPIYGHIVAKRSGHAFHHAFVEKFFLEKDAWQTKFINTAGDLIPRTEEQFAN